MCVGAHDLVVVTEPGVTLAKAKKCVEIGYRGVSCEDWDIKSLAVCVETEIDLSVCFRTVE